MPVPHSLSTRTGMSAPNSLFIFAFGSWRRCFAALCTGLSVRFFHRLASFFGTLGAGFGALLAFLVDDLLRAEQFDVHLHGAIALLPSFVDDAQVSAIAVT